MQSTSSTIPSVTRARSEAAAADADERTRPAGDTAGPADEPVLEDLLVEDVSIDGMCGVY